MCYYVYTQPMNKSRRCCDVQVRVRRSVAILALRVAPYLDGYLNLRCLGAQVCRFGPKGYAAMRASWYQLCHLCSLGKLELCNSGEVQGLQSSPRWSGHR